MASMFRYGICLEERSDQKDFLWRIATIDPYRSDHEVLVVSKNEFKFNPKLGDTVKIGFTESNDIKDVRKVNGTEWLRDVEVINRDVVIHSFVHIKEDALRKVYYSMNKGSSNREYYVFEDRNTDFAKVAISKSVVDYALSHRHPRQKQDELRMYRVGVYRSPIDLNDGTKVKWKHHEDTPLVPIFEQFEIDSIVPYIHLSIVYGVQEAIVVDVNENGALFWSPQMGCSVLSSVTTSNLPEVGKTFAILTQRSLAEDSFNFPCYYELMPLILKLEWKNLKVYVEKTKKRLYIETKGRCRRKYENPDELVFDLPNLGPVSRGLESYADMLEVGKEYDCRLEFDQLRSNGPIEPVIRDVLLHDDVFAVCNIVLVSQDQERCYAIVEPECRDKRLKNEIAFVDISKRVLWCYYELTLTDDLILSTVEVRVRKPRSANTICHCLDIRNFANAQYRNGRVLRNIGDRGWLRTSAYFESAPRDGVSPIWLRCHNTNLLMVDQTRLCDQKQLTQCREVFVNAQCVIVPGNLPVFLVRHVAPRFTMLESLKESVVLNLPPLSQIFEPVASSSIDSGIETNPNEHRNRRMKKRIANGDNSNIAGLRQKQHMENYEVFSRDISPTPTSRSYGTEVLCESAYSPDSTITSRTLNDADDDVPFILNEEEFEQQKKKDLRENEKKERKEPKHKTAGFPSKTTSWDTPGPSYSGPNSRPIRSHYSSSSLSQQLSSRSSLPRKHYRVGVRHWGSDLPNDESLVQDCIYNCLAYRPMYMDNQESHLKLWESEMRLKGILLKETSAEAIGIERIDCREDYRYRKCKYEWLVRFYVKTGEIPTTDRIVVAPIGGIFTNLPDGFLLGKSYEVIHYSRPSDTFVRLSGLGRNPIDCLFQELTNGLDVGPSCIVKDENQKEFLRMRTVCERPCAPLYKSDTFELWTSTKIEGLIIAELDNLILEHLDPDSYELYEVDCILEPIAGGPYSLYGKLPDSPLFRHADFLVLWRVVTVFSSKEDPHKPYIVKRVPLQSSLENNKKSGLGFGVVHDSFVTTSVLEIASTLTEEKLGRLRAVDDVRVRRQEEKDVHPEIGIRIISDYDRKEMALKALIALKNVLKIAHRHRILEDVSPGEIEERVQTWRSMTDGEAIKQKAKSTRVIKEACNYLMRFLKIEDNLRKMHSTPELKEPLRQISTCLVYNRSYVDKTEWVKKNYNYFYENKLCPPL